MKRSSATDYANRKSPGCRSASSLSTLLAAGLLASAAIARAEEPKQIDVPAGDLLSAIETLAKQSDEPLLYQPQHLKGARTAGVSGILSTQDAIRKLLEGTQLRLSVDASTGVMMIAPKSGTPTASNVDSPTSRDASSSASIHSAQLRLAQSAELPSAGDGTSRSIERQRNPSEAIEGETQGADRLGEIVVTAQKRAQSLIEVPISMTVLGADELEARRTLSIQDMAFAVPNLTFYKVSNFDIGLTLRGISGRTGGRFDPIGVTVDGVSFGVVDNAPILSARFLDIDRIEVLRGPQGTLNANNAMGGVLNVVTARPDPTGFYYKGTLDYGRFDTAFLRGVVNVPASEQLAFRAVGYGVRSDGAVKNIGPSGGDSGEESYGGRIAVRWMPTSQLTIDTAFASEKQNLGIEGAMPLDRFVNGAARRTQAINAYAALGGDYFAGDFIEGSGNNGGHVRLDVDEHTDVENTFASFHGAYRLERHTVDLIYSYYDFKLFNPIDYDQTEYAVRRYDRTNRVRSHGAELRFTSDYATPLNWVAGVSYSREKNPTFNDARFGDNQLGGAYPTLWFKFDQKQNLDNLGIYANLFWDISERLHLSAGLRYSSIKSEYGSVTVLTGGLNAVVPAYPLTSADLNETSPRIALNYDIAERASVYATYATGNRAGFGNLTNAVGTHLTTIGTLDIPGAVTNESVKNYEVGLKGLFLDRRLNVAAAAYHMDYEDLQVQAGLVLDANEPGLAFNLNAGKAYTRGMEFEAAARLLEGFQVSVGAGYVKTRIKELNNAPPPSRDIPAVRPWTTNATVTYEFPVAAEWRASLRADYVWQDSTHMSLARVPATEIPEFQSTNFAATFSRKSLSLTAYIQNAFGETYWVGGPIGDGPYSGGLATFIPRTYGLRLTLQSGD